MKRMNKKGIELTMNTLIIVIILTVTMVIILLGLYRFNTEGSNDTKGILGDLRGDFDGDGVKDAIDPCPCEANQEKPCEIDANQCVKDRNPAPE